MLLIHIVPMLYPYTLILDTSELFTLWEDCESGGDRFTSSCYPGRIIAFASLADLKRYAVDKQLPVSWDEAGSFDADHFDSVLISMKPGQAYSIEQCATILEGWNFLEDFCRTLSQDTKMPRSGGARSVYEKLFYGNNLPSVTPVGKCYEPMFDVDELEDLYDALDGPLRLLRSKSSIASQ